MWSLVRFSQLLAAGANRIPPPAPTLTWDTGVTDVTPTFTINFDETFCSVPITASNFDVLVLEYSQDVTFAGTPTSTVSSLSLGDISTGSKALTLGTISQGTWYARALHRHIEGGVLTNSVWSNVVTKTIDTVAPTSSISAAAGQDDPTSETPVNFTVTFNESVTGFATGDISFTGSTTGGGSLVGTVTGSGTTYNVEVTGMTTDGNVVARVPASVAADAAGNLNTISPTTSTVAWLEPDVEAPGPPTLDLVSTSDTGLLDTDNLTNDTTPDLDIIFASIPLEDDVLDLYDNTVLLVSHTITALEAGNGVLDLGLSPLAAGSHSLTAVHVRDGQTSDLSAALVIVIDVTAPTISTAATANNNEGTTLGITLVANETVTWSKAGTGVDEDHFQISGTTLQWLGNGTKNYEAPDDDDGNRTYIIDIRATDTAGNITDKTITVTVVDVAEGTTNREIMLANGYVVNTSTTTRQWQAGTTFNVEN